MTTPAPPGRESPALLMSLTPALAMPDTILWLLRQAGLKGRH
jgi:hypothetical protein